MITFQRNGFQVLEKDTFGRRGDLYTYIKGTEEDLTIVSLFLLSALGAYPQVWAGTKVNCFGGLKLFQTGAPGGAGG